MQYEAHQIYHIFNQGNNRQQLFFEEENYLFFLYKIRRHILPLGDLLSYCLMPNHFHLLFVPNQEATLPSAAVKPKRKWVETQLEGTSEVPSNALSLTTKCKPAPKTHSTASNR